MFNEGLYSDTYVHSQLTAKQWMMRRLFIAACIILPLLGMLVFRSIVVTLIAIIIDIILIYYLPNKKVDYEYVFVDGQIDFDRIIAQTTRKNMFRTDLEKAEIVAPEKSHSLDSYQNIPLRDYSSGQSEDKHYIMIVHDEKGNCRVKFTPNEHLLDQMEMKAKSKIER